MLFKSITVVAVNKTSACGASGPRPVGHGTCHGDGEVSALIDLRTTHVGIARFATEITRTLSFQFCHLFPPFVCFADFARSRSPVAGAFELCGLENPPLAPEHQVIFLLAATPDHARLLRSESVTERQIANHLRVVFCEQPRSAPTSQHGEKLLVIQFVVAIYGMSFARDTRGVWGIGVATNTWVAFRFTYHLQSVTLNQSDAVTQGIHMANVFRDRVSAPAVVNWHPQSAVEPAAIGTSGLNHIAKRALLGANQFFNICPV